MLGARLRGGSLQKAGKGALRLPLPAGYEYDETGRVRVRPDEAVADAIATVFSSFETLTSARQVMLRLLGEDRQLPRKASADRQVRSVEPTYRAIHDILTNPAFAGAYAYGRKRTERRGESGVVSERQRRAPGEEWHVCIEGHHPGWRRGVDTRRAVSALPLPQLGTAWSGRRLASVVDRHPAARDAHPHRTHLALGRGVRRARLCR